MQRFLLIDYDYLILNIVKIHIFNINLIELFKNFFNLNNTLTIQRTPDPFRGHGHVDILGAQGISDGVDDGGRAPD